MRKNRLYIGLLIAAMLVVIFYVSNGMINAGKEEEYYSVAVILDNSSSDRWNAFKEGMEQGAEDNHILLNLVSTASFVGLEEECSIIERELENGADGVIVQVCGDDTNGLFAGTVSAKPAILVESPIIQSEEMFTTIMPDQYKLGSAIAENVIAGEALESGGASGEDGGEQSDDITGEAEENGSAGVSVSGEDGGEQGDDIVGEAEENESAELSASDVSEQKLRIGVLSGNQKMVSQRQRLEGFEDTIVRADVQVAWVLAENQVTESSLEDYQRENPVDVLVTLDNDETELAVDFLLSHPNVRWSLYGEGRSEKAVYYLDKGMIRALVVPNEFYMGYQAVEAIAQRINYYMSAGENQEVDFLSVTRENLHDQSTEKILFPTVS